MKSPRASLGTLETYAAQRAVVDALRADLASFRGTVLDIGCGRRPYRDLLLAPPSRATRYVGLDLGGGAYGAPDLVWDGVTMPLASGSVDAALSTDVLEHCPDPSLVLREAARVLRPGGFLFVVVPFLWPLHDVPHDHARYTPFALERLLRDAGFADVAVRALGGWDASLARMLALWVRRRPMPQAARAVLSALAAPLVLWLERRDRAPRSFAESQMLTGLAATATKPRR